MFQWCLQPPTRNQLLFTWSLVGRYVLSTVTTPLCSIYRIVVVSSFQNQLIDPPQCVSVCMKRFVVSRQSQLCIIMRDEVFVKPETMRGAFHRVFFCHGNDRASR